MISSEQIAEARARTDVYAAATVLKRQGAWQTGRCPLHEDASPSFGVKDGRWCCFAGCGRGDPIEFVMRLRHVSFQEAVQELLNTQREQSGTARKAPSTRGGRSAVAETVGVQPAARHGDDEVRAILRQSGPITERSAAWLYLWSRGLPTRQPGLLSHPDLYCHETGARLPALIAPITGSDGEVRAVQRIWCRDHMDGGDKDSRAVLSVRKKTLGTMGDGAVHLSPVRRLMGLAEGVETALAAAKLHSMPVWAVCGAARLGSVWLPAEVKRLVIFGDRGVTGEAMAYQAAEAHRGRGLACSALFPDPPHDDFNTELLARAR